MEIFGNGIRIPALAFLLVLAGCGGGGGSEVEYTPGQTVPENMTPEQKEALQKLGGAMGLPVQPQQQK